MSKFRLHVTLDSLKKANACERGYNQVIEWHKQQGIKLTNKTKINLLTILKSNNVADTLWALNCVIEVKFLKEFSIKIAAKFSARAADAAIYAARAADAAARAADARATAARATDAAARAADAAAARAADAAEIEKQKQDLLELLEEDEEVKTNE